MSQLTTVDRWALFRPLAIRDFRLLWVGEGVSLLGNQFYLVALSWLTLQLTGSGTALGTVLMTAAVPRAALMLVGGAMTDRLSPRPLMIVSNMARAALTAILTVLIFTDTVALGYLYALAILFGTFDAFFYPAFRSIVPWLVNDEQLEPANSLLQGTSQLSILLGPLPAGVLVAAVGVGPAFVINVASFVFATGMLWLMRTGGSLNRASEPADVAVESAAPPSGPTPPPGTADGSKRRGRLLHDIVEGLRYAWADPVLRTILILVAAIDFAAVGPITVGLAALADARFLGGAAAFGAMMSAWGGGTFLGSIIAGIIGRPRRRGYWVIAVGAVFGVGLTALSWAPLLVLAVVVIGLMGIGGGLINVMMFSWLQGRTESRLIGRVMSLVMFASQGLAPFSYLLAGVLVDVSLPWMYVGAGTVMLAATLYATSQQTIRSID